jgi:hypothetical protein
LLLAPNLRLKAALHYIKTGFCIFFLLPAFICKAQYKVKGTVFDSSHRYTIESVSVMSTGGKGTSTDSMGRYSIDVNEKDSVWFSFLGKATPKYPVLNIQDVNRFDISLRIKMNYLAEVKVRTRIYKEDSVQNRKDYAKVFNFRRPNLSTMTSITPGGVGFDLDEIFRLFQFRKNRNMEKFRERLLAQEREKFIDHRFTKALVRTLTGLDGEQLTRFMTIYRPSYDFVLLSTDYDFRLYIKNSGEAFKQQGKSF